MLKSPLILLLLMGILFLQGSCATVRQLEDSVKKMVKGQSYNQRALVAALHQDAEKIHREFTKTLEKLKGQIKRKWGSQDVKVADRTKYVKYTDEYASRAIVDFDRGKITVETLDGSESTDRLKTVLVSTLLTPSDPQSVDLFSDKNISLSKDKKPYLYGLVLDQKDHPIGTQEQADRFADYAVKNLTKTRKGQGEEGDRSVRFVKLKMVKNYESKQADQYRPFVKKYADQYKISPSLVLAVIKTESNFNPFAVSDAPAYGLMQLVPTSGGREAYKLAKGTDQDPTAEYLFDPEHNIELGTAYLSVLTYNELEAVSDSVSRDYCVIAAYNTGPGNVLKTFSRNRLVAFKVINGMDSGELFDQLRSSLPYRETRQYLKKVVNNRKQFILSSEDML